jgi:hypothetical protein
METTISVFLKEYKCYVTEQSGRARGTRYKAYGTFDEKFIDAQGPSINSALRKLKRSVEIALD